MKRKLSAVGLAMTLIIAMGMAGCSGDKGGGASYTGAYISCVDTDGVLCGSGTASLKGGGILDFLVPPAFAATTIVETTFTLGDIHMINDEMRVDLTILNDTPGVFEGMVFAEVQINGLNWTTVTYPITLPASQSTIYTIWKQGSIANHTGAGTQLFYLHACDEVFTVEMRDGFWQADFIDRFKALNHTPAAIATAYYNIIQ